MTASSSRRFDALVFDFGGPVIRTGFEMLPMFERRLGLAPGTFRRLGPFDVDGDLPWRRLQAGEITEPGYWEGYAAELAGVTGESSVRTMMRMLYDTPESEFVRPEARAVLAAAKRAGMRAGVLTNDLALFHEPALIKSLAFLEDVDVMVDGSVIGVLKPDPLAYRTIARELGVETERMIFVDDQPRNVAGARAVGMTAVWFDVTRPGASYRELAELAGLDVSRDVV